MADGSLIEKRFPGIAERARQTLERAAAQAEGHAAVARQMFLPGMDEFMRAMPDPVADSSLFAPVAREGRGRCTQGLCWHHA